MQVSSRPSGAGYVRSTTRDFDEANSDDVVALTAKYGGLLWGEHGKVFAPNTARRFSVRNFLQNS